MQLSAMASKFTFFANAIKHGKYVEAIIWIDNEAIPIEKVRAQTFDVLPGSPALIQLKWRNYANDQFFVEHWIIYAPSSNKSVNLNASDLLEISDEAIASRHRSCLDDLQDASKEQDKWFRIHKDGIALVTFTAHKPICFDSCKFDKVDDFWLSCWDNAFFRRYAFSTLSQKIKTD